MAVEVIEENAQEVIPLAKTLEAPEGEDEIAARKAEEAEAVDKEKGASEGEKETTAAKTPEEIAAAEASAAEAAAVEALKNAKENGASNAEISELRGMIRDLRNDNIRLQGLVAKHERVQNNEVGADNKPEEIEELQAVITKAAERQGEFESLLAVMEVNPKYEDVLEVCTKSNFEDIFESVARYRAEQNGTQFNVEYLGAKAEVWSMANPYKYMYEVIKEFHPGYKATPAKEAAAKEVDTKTKTAAAVVREKKAVVAPGSIADVATGDSSQGGWTAARIDALDETKLHTVPRDIYNKWLRGELD